MKEKPLRVTGDDLSSLWTLVNDRRADAQIVKVDPKLLTKLLLDHQYLLEKHNGDKS